MQIAEDIMKLTGVFLIPWLIAGLVGCTNGAPPPSAPDAAPDDPLPPSDSCSPLARDCQGFWPEPARSTGVVPKSISYNAIGADSLMFNALLRNGRANAAMTHDSLPSLLAPEPTDGSDAAYVQLQLQDPFARHVMDYLVGCALPAGDSVSWMDPVSETTLTWSGELGLCKRWQTGSIAGDAACQELVSACLLARNNAFKEEVLISLRGGVRPDDATSTALPLEDEATGGEPCDAESFAPVCSPSGMWEEATSNCPGVSGMPFPGRWHSQHIGTCTSDKTVTLGVTPDPMSCTDALRIRICRGIYGCDSGSPEHIQSIEIPCDTTDTITFTCPAEDEAFTLMYANAARERPASGFDVSVVTPEGMEPVATYPAPEKHVFPWQEGAFYGNLFCNDVSCGYSPSSPPGNALVDLGLSVAVCDDLDEECDNLEEPNMACDAVDRFCDGHDVPGTVVYRQAAVNPANDEVKPVYAPITGTEYQRLEARVVGHEAFLAGYTGVLGVVYQRMYSCIAPNWDPDEAYLKERLCAGPDGTKSCAAHSMGRCRTAAGTQCQCSEDDQSPIAGDWDYGDCEGSFGSMWQHPVTVFLNDPCAIVPETVLPDGDDLAVPCKTVPICRQTTRPLSWQEETAPPRPGT